MNRPRRSHVSVNEYSKRHSVKNDTKEQERSWGAETPLASARVSEIFTATYHRHRGSFEQSSVYQRYNSSEYTDDLLENSNVFCWIEVILRRPVAKIPGLQDAGHLDQKHATKVRQEEQVCMAPSQTIEIHFHCEGNQRGSDQAVANNIQAGQRM